MKDEEPEDFLELFARELQERPGWDRRLNVDAFQKTFGPHFPRLAEDKRAAAAEFGWLHTFFNPWTVFEIQQKDALKRLIASKAEIRNLGGAKLPQQEAVEWRSLYSLRAELGGLVRGEQVTTTEDAEMRILAVLNELQGLHKAGLLEPALESLCERISRSIEETPKAGKAGHRAARAVGLFRELWRRNTGKEAPHSLNRAGAFEDYLEDGFKYLRIGGRPVPAMRRWAATQ